MINESKELRVDQLGPRKDIDKLVFIAYDTETTGLHSYQGPERSLKIKFDYKNRKTMIDSFVDQIKKENKLQDKKAIDSEAYRRYHSLKKKEPEIELAEIAAIAFKADGEELGRFHQFVKFTKETTSPFIFKFIGWSDEKDSKSIHPETALISFDKWLKKWPNAILIAHNLPFDQSLLVGLAKKHGVTTLASNLKSRNQIDTRKTTKIREFFKGLLPTTIYKGKTQEVNNLNKLIDAFGIKNETAHTAISDVVTLKKLFLKLLQLAEVIANPHKFGKQSSSDSDSMM